MPRSLTQIILCAWYSIYVGAHFPLAIYDGVTLGNKVADYVFDNLDRTVGWSSVNHHAGW